MNAIVKYLVIVFILLLNFSIVTLSQPPRVWQNGDGSNVNASTLQYSAPLDDGFIILLVLASIYGLIKYFNYKKAKKMISYDSL